MTRAGGSESAVLHNLQGESMSRRLSVALGARHAMPAPAPLALAIGQHLHASQSTQGWRRASGFAASALSLALLPAIAAQAATITVDSATPASMGDGSCQLSEAVANANADADTSSGDCVAGSGLDEILFDGTLAGTTITVGGTLTVSDALEVDGAGAPGVALVPGAPSRLFDASADLTLSNLAIRDSFSPGAGGAVYADAALDVDNVEFSNNRSKYDSGGAILANGPLTVTNSVFYDNQAGKYDGDLEIGHGGAIAANDTLTITGSTFGYNEAYGAGGAVFAAAGGDISGSTFVYNEGYLGGAVFAGNPDELLQPAPQTKGVVAPQALAMTIGASDFIGNTASRSAAEGTIPIAGMGGAVAFMPESSSDGSLAHALTITDSDFSLNAAIPGGPPLQPPPPTAQAKGPKYLTVGGALAVTLAPGSTPETADALAFELQGGTLDQNFALFGGGAVVAASTITVDASSFDQNSALFAGGAMLGGKYGKYATDGSTVTVTDSGFTNNGAMYVGGVLLGAETVAASGLTVTGNVAGTPQGYSGEVRAKGELYGPYLPEFACDAYSGKYVGGALVSAESSLTLSGTNLVDDNCAGDVAGLLVEVAGSAVIGPATVVSNNRAMLPDAYAGGLQLDAVEGASVLFQGTVSGNSSAYDGAGLRLDASGTAVITLDGATVSGNTAGRAGGGVLVHGGTGGAVILANSTLSGNSASAGGGLYVAAPRPPELKGKGATQTVSLTNVTVHGNDATSALVAKGGVVAGSGGGIAVADGSSLAADFVTVTGNAASGAGGGLWVGPAANAMLANSIVAENTAASGPDIAGTVTAHYTLVGDGSGAVVNGTGNDTSGSDPLLGPLQDNGGPTLTRAPLPGSPVLDSGDPGFVPPPEFDQRGPGFPRVVNGQVDMGSVEVALPVVTAIDIAPAAIAEGASGTVTVTLDGPASGDVLATVDFTGTAILGSDFSVADADAGTPGIQVLVETGSSSGSATLSATSDGVDEPDEGFTATVSAASGATLAGTLQASGTIVDGEPAPTVTLSLDQSLIVEEGGSTTVTATLSAPTFQDVTIMLGFGGTATLGSDYSTTGTQIVIPAGSTSGSIVISTVDDDLDEGDETVVIDILSVTNGTESGVQQGTVVIDDTADGTVTDPSAPAPVPQPTVIPTLSEWMLMLLGLLLPATVVSRLRRREAAVPRRR